MGLIKLLTVISVSLLWVSSYNCAPTDCSCKDLVIKPSEQSCLLGHLLQIITQLINTQAKQSGSKFDLLGSQLGATKLEKECPTIVIKPPCHKTTIIEKEISEEYLVPEEIAFSVDEEVVPDEFIFEEEIYEVPEVSVEEIYEVSEEDIIEEEAYEVPEKPYKIFAGDSLFKSIFDTSAVVGTLEDSVPETDEVTDVYESTKIVKEVQVGSTAFDTVTVSATIEDDIDDFDEASEEVTVAVAFEESIEPEESFLGGFGYGGFYKPNKVFEESEEDIEVTVTVGENFESAELSEESDEEIEVTVAIERPESDEIFEKISGFNIFGKEISSESEDVQVTVTIDDNSETEELYGGITGFKGFGIFGKEISSESEEDIEVSVTIKDSSESEDLFEELDTTTIFGKGISSESEDIEVTVTIKDDSDSVEIFEETTKGFGIFGKGIDSESEEDIEVTLTIGDSSESEEFFARPASIFGIFDKKIIPESEEDEEITVTATITEEDDIFESEEDIKIDITVDISESEEFTKELVSDKDLEVARGIKLYDDSESIDVYETSNIFGAGFGKKIEIDTEFVEEPKRQPCIFKSLLTDTITGSYDEESIEVDAIIKESESIEVFEEDDFSSTFPAIELDKTKEVVLEKDTCEKYYPQTLFIPVIKFDGTPCLTSDELREYVYNIFRKPCKGGVTFPKLRARSTD